MLLLLLLLLRPQRNPYRMYTWKEGVLLHICQEREKKKRNGAIRSVRGVLTGTFPLSSATRGGPPRGRRRRDRAVPSCGPTRPALYPCPFASPCRDPAPSPDPSSPSPLSPILCLAACARSPCSSLAPSRAHVPGFCPTLFRPQAAKAATLETKNRLLIKPSDCTLPPSIHARRNFDNSIDIVRRIRRRSDRVPNESKTNRCILFKPADPRRKFLVNSSSVNSSKMYRTFLGFRERNRALKILCKKLP